MDSFESGVPFSAAVAAGLSACASGSVPWSCACEELEFGCVKVSAVLIKSWGQLCTFTCTLHIYTAGGDPLPPVHGVKGIAPCPTLLRRGQCWLCSKGSVCCEYSVNS